MAVLAFLALGSGGGLAVGLSVPESAERVDAPRALTTAEARRLAAMRVTNHRDGAAAVQADVGPPDRRTHLAGWVDWSRQLAYLAVTGPGAGTERGLLQVAPGLIATHPESTDPGTTQPGTAHPETTHPATAHPETTHPATADPETTDLAGQAASRSPSSAAASAPAPPATPPGTGWRIRQPDPGRRPLDAVLGLLFGVAADRPDPVEPIAAGSARWLGRGQAGGVPVDILLGPAVPVTTARAPAPPTSSAGAATPLAGAVRYWVDDAARLRRLETRLAGDLPVAIDLARDPAHHPVAIAALGGPPVRPRTLTEPEVGRLSRLGTVDRARGGARVTLTLPSVPGVDLTGAGWVDWRRETAYLAVRDPGQRGGTELLRADGAGVAVRTAPPHPGPDPTRTPAVADPAPTLALPPLPPPRDRHWHATSWRERSGPGGAGDLDLLISEALTMGRHTDDAAHLRSTALWLRSDTVGGQRVEVFEMPKPAEAGEPPGRARFRYWVNGDGLLRRLELRTRAGAFAQLDLSPGPVPRIDAVPVD